MLEIGFQRYYISSRLRSFAINIDKNDTQENALLHTEDKYAMKLPVNLLPIKKPASL